MEELAERGWSKEYEAWRNGSGLAVRKRKERRSAWAGVASVLLLLGMWCAPGYAAEAQEPVVLTPSEIVELGLEADANLKIAKLNLDNAEIAYQRNVANNLLVNSAQAAFNAEVEWKRAQANYQGQVADAVISLLQQAIDLRRAELRAQVEEIRISLARLEYERARERVRAGIANEDSLVEAELALVGRELEFDEVSISLESQRESLANRIGVRHFSLGAMPEFMPYSVDVEAALPKALESSADWLDSRAGVENARREVERLNLEGAPPLDIRQAENHVAIAEIRLASVERQLKESLESAARTINRTAVNYEIAVRQLELAQRRLAITQRQAEAGFVTQDTVSNARIQALEAESARLEALKNYLVAVLNFEKLIGADLRESVVLRGGPHDGEAS